MMGDLESQGVEDASAIAKVCSNSGLPMNHAIGLCAGLGCCISRAFASRSKEAYDTISIDDVEMGRR